MVSAYLKCLKEYNLRTRTRTQSPPITSNTLTTEAPGGLSSSGELCRPLAKLYLECRMKAGLMTLEDLNELGY